MGRFADRLIVGSATLAMLTRHWVVAYRFWQSTGRLPKLCPPLQQWDKFFWRKVFDHNPMFEVFCDKLASKDWASRRCPDLLVPITYWQGDSACDIPDELLKQPAFIKANNGSGYNVRIDGQTVDRSSIEVRFSRWLSRPYGQGNAEWGYRNVPRTVFLEEVVAGLGGASPVMIEVYATAGKPAAVLCVTWWKDEPRHASFFDLNGDRVSAQPDDIPRLHADWQPPSGFGKAIGFSKLLVEGMDQVRCDFMCVGGKVWFSEMTPCTLSGLETFESPDQENYIYGAWDLRQSWFLQKRHRGWKQVYAEALQRML